MRQRDVIRSLKLDNNEHIRMDCPFCGHRNTLSVSNEYGHLIWHCFHADCNARGRAPVDMTQDQIVELFTNKDAPEKDMYTFRKPDYWVSPLTEERAMNFIEDYNCADAYDSGRVMMRYDPKLDRLVFIVENNGAIYDAVGRGLYVGCYPKWLRYGISNFGLFCPARRGYTTRGCILVEDAASACSASTVMDSVALLGTNVLGTMLGRLRTYKTVYVCLDPDATHKAYDLQHKLAAIVPSKVVPIDDDLKYFTADEIHAMLDRAGCKV